MDSYCLLVHKHRDSLRTFLLSLLNHATCWHSHKAPRKELMRTDLLVSQMAEVGVQNNTGRRRRPVTVQSHQYKPRQDQ